jgi:hypothetical protein
MIEKEVRTDFVEMGKRRTIIVQIVRFFCLPLPTSTSVAQNDSSLSSAKKGLTRKPQPKRSQLAALQDRTSKPPDKDAASLSILHKLHLHMLLLLMSTFYLI